jgi:ribonucleoside-diphosphate reductase alpha chain
MKVKKRDGSLEEMRYDKITRRIQNFCDDLNLEYVDPTWITLKVTQGIYDGISTTELDVLAAETAASLVTSHSDYAKLAGRLAVSNLHKTTPKKFSQSIKELHSFVEPKTNKESSLISNETYSFVQQHKDVLDGAIVQERDFDFDYFGFKTLERSYLLKIGNRIVERPQYMYMRVAVGICNNDIETALRIYDDLSQHFYTHATPTLFNAGTHRPQMSSCFLIGNKGDDINGLFDTIKDVANISKWAGGIGLHVHDVRGKGAYIKGTGGESDGLLPMLKTYNEVARWINQCFAPDTLLYTDMGIKKIDEVIPGDLVLNKDRKYVEVGEVFVYHQNGGMIEIETKSTIKPLKLTDSHPLFGFKNTYNRIGRENFEFINQLEKGIISPDWIDSGEYKVGDFIGKPIPKEIIDIEDFTENDSFIYGLLLGDGHIYKNEVGISFNRFTNEKEIDFTINYLTNKEINFWKNEDGAYLSIRFSLSKLPWLRYEFLYNEKKEKRIHKNFSHLPLSKSIQLIHGLIKSDGGVYRKNEIHFYNTSEELIENLSYQILRFGVPTYGSWRLRENSSEYLKENGCTKEFTYSCDLRIPSFNELSELLNIDTVTKKNWIIWEDILYTRITKVKMLDDYNGKVYDLKIKENSEDPSYTLTSCLVHNGGKRRGSFAIYLEPWHSDVFEFIELRKNHGKEELRARDLFLAMWVPDLFMKRVEQDLDWSLFSPDEAPGLSDVYDDPYKFTQDFTELYEKYESEGKARKVVKARKLMDAILTAQIETGTPYMLYKDAANYKSNQKNLGTIKSSNLCITGDQRVVTTKGYLTTKELYEIDEELELFNNSEIVKSSKMIKRGENEDVYKITLENGMEHKVTPYHGIPIIDSRNNITRVECKNLKIGDKIPIQTKKGLFGDVDMIEEAFLLGLYQSDGTQSLNTLYFDIWENDFDLIDEIEKSVSNLYEKYNYTPRYSNKGGKFIDCEVKFSAVKKKRLTSEFFKKDLKFEKGYIPNWIWSSNEKTQWSYLRGLLYADGTAHISNNKGNPIQISYVDINIDFLKELQILFNNLGLQTSIRLLRKSSYNLLPDGKGGKKHFKTKDCFRLIIGNKNDAIVLNKETGFLDRKGIKLENKTYRNNTKKGYKVISIDYIGKEDVYCPTIYNDEHIFISQGLKTFNCSEIIEYSSPEEQAVCNLASIALPKYIINKEFSHELLYEYVYQVVKNLNNVIDLNFYPTEETKLSNMRHRPVGLGIQGLADVFCILKLPFESEEADKLQVEIFETIYFAALSSSKDLSKENGPYSSYEGSPISQGKFQYELWGKKDEDNSGRWDWKSLRKEIVKFGVRNSLLVAPMPTASTAQILGNNEAFEPFTSNLYSRRTLGGEFIVINKHLVNELLERGLWSDDIKKKLIMENGSVQNIPEIPVDVKEVYKTVWEMSQKRILMMAANRSVYIDQSQSLNLFIDNASKTKVMAAHLYGWKLGLKTGMYYLRTKAAVDPIKGLGVDTSSSKPNIEKNTTIVKEQNLTTNYVEETVLSIKPSDSPFECEGCGS